MTKFFSTNVFHCCFWIRDPGWVKIRIRDKHPGSATLHMGIWHIHSFAHVLVVADSCLGN
jgi:hypothetical protein